MHPRLNRALLQYVRATPLKYKRAGIYDRLVAPELKRRPVQTIVSTRFGASFHCSTDDVIQRYLYSFGVWEPAITDFVSSRLRPGDTFVDVGANIGYFSLLASGLVGPDGQVVAIEPSPSIHEELQANLSLNERPNMRAVAVAASDCSGVATIFRAGNANRGSSSLLASRGFDVESEVPTLPLADILTETEIRTARIMKIDVEGHEASVVDGLLPALPSTRADLELLIEISPEELVEQGTSAAAILCKMESAGFHAFRIENGYEPFRYINGMIARRAERLTSPPSGPVAWDVVFSREDRSWLPVRETRGFVPSL